MKKIIHLIFLVFLSIQLAAQNFTGQWKGEFIDKSTSFTGWGGDRCEYILEIECTGTKVTGYSYTYFSADGGKRYYTICKLNGTLNKASKTIEVKEVERTKTNVPVTIRNCFQIHRLSYSQQNDDQILEGTWVPVPNQEGDCGFGTTVLSRRHLQKNPAYLNNTTAKTSPKKTTPVVTPKTEKTQPPVVKIIPQNKTTPPAVKIQPKKITPPVVKTQPKKIPAPVAKADPKKAAAPPVVKTETEKKTNGETVTGDIKNPDIQSIKPDDEKKLADPRYEKRNADLLKTIEIDNASFTVDLYDNGDIDGDSISLFFNGKLLLSHKRLSDKALRLKLDVDASRDVNELIMYAENLGTIPPNTALMVVNDGDNRYEVRISSDLQKSGVIRFVHKPKNKQ
jgi:hypothetical protein